MSVNQNEPVAVPAQPAPGQPAAPALKPSALQEKYGGDWGKANEGYFNAVSKIGELHNTTQTQAARIQQLEAMLSPIVSGGQPAPADPLTRLNTELGLPIEPFAEAIDSRAEQAANRVLAKLLGPIVSEMEATEKLSGEVENFEALKGKARAIMSQSPEVLETFNAVRAVNPAAAWKYAIREALTAESGAPKPPPAATGFTSGMTPQGRAAVNPAGLDQGTREKEALDYGKQYGDMRPYSHERLKDTSVERHIKDILKNLGIPTEGASTRW